KPRILIAPLDWGLGHATRCIPIIKDLLYLNCEVIIVATKSTFSLLKKEFPSLVFLRCKGYEISYSRDRKKFLSKILSQFPKMIFSVWKENYWLKKIIKKERIDAVISDNRFGMYSKKIPSIYITHQLGIKTGNRTTEIIAQKIHYYFIKKYSQCWIPDSKEIGLAGELSHPPIIPSNAIFIGPLSRFKSLPDIEKIYDLLITISGPEPVRTIFENKILNQLKGFPGKTLLIRGVPFDNYKLPSSDLLEIENHLSAEELNKALEQSKMLIGRSGYTTVMDLAALKKKAILIPTPGQTEQEYLAKYLFDKKYFFSANEENFSIEDALQKASEFEFKNIDMSLNEYKKTINEFVLSLKSGNFASQ
ncbi:MAG: glycosyltransferase, partial [Ginsengibacter sp.]